MKLARSRAFDFKTSGKWIVLSTVVGVIAGLGAVVFNMLTAAVVLVGLKPFAHFIPPEAAGETIDAHIVEGDFRPWAMVAVMACGGLLSGILVYTFAPEAEGHGTDAAIDAFHNRRGRIRARIPLIKTLASAITLGTGGSAGREGPIAQIGAGFGSVLATRLKLSARDRRILLAAGMATGIGAIFRAPLAGALFAAEILYSQSDFEADVIIPAAASSIIGYSVYCLTLPQELRYVPLFGPNLNFAPAEIVQLIPYAGLSVLLVGVAFVYCKVFYGTHALFAKVPVPRPLRSSLGAMLAGLLGIGLFYAFGEDPRVLAVLATGYGTLQQSLTEAGGVGVVVLLTVAIGKIVTTSLTISSGGSGGVFGPSMVIGGCLGAAYGIVMHAVWPQAAPYPEAFGIVGMAGFFAGAAHAPFSTIIMVSEMTGGYELLLPSMWVCTLCFVMSQRFTLYVNQVPTRLESPAHRGDFLVDVLEGIKVVDVYDTNRTITRIPESMSLEEIVHQLAMTQQHYFPVVDDDGRVVGIFSGDDVRAYLYDETIWKLAVARDVMNSRVVSVTPDDDLNVAMQKFTSIAIDELPVVDSKDRGHLLGTLRHKETIAAYNKRLMEFKQSQDEQV